MGAIREIVRSHIAQHQGEVKEGRRDAAMQIQRLLRTKKVGPTAISVKEMFEEFCDPDRKIVLSGPRSSVAVAEALDTSWFPIVMHEVITPIWLEQVAVGLGDALSLVREVNDVKRQKVEVPGIKRDVKLREVFRREPYDEGQMHEDAVEISQHKFGVILSLSKEDIIFDQTGQLLADAADLGIETGSHLHRFIVEKVTDVAVDATGEAAETCLSYKGTNYAIFSADHSTIDGQTNNNLTTTAFGHAGIKAVIQMLRRMLDFKGDPVKVAPTQLLVPPEIEGDADTLYSSPLTPEDANTAKNIYERRFRPIVSEFMSSATRWFMGDFQRQYMLLWVWKPQIIEQGADTTLAFEQDIVQRWRASYFAGIGARDYRYVTRNGT